MKRAYRKGSALIFAGLITGCAARAPSMVLMVHPETGQIKECRPRTLYINGIPIDDQRNLNECVKQYQAGGFATADDIQRMEKLGFDKRLAPVFNRIIQEEAEKIEKYCAANDCTK